MGREEQLAVLDRTLAGAAAGRGRLVLVAGEPGIGKTRLAEEVARQAAVRGVRVAWGRCFEGEGAPAFWPWVQVVRQLLAEVAPAQLGMVLGPSAGELSQLLPELKELVPGLEPPPVVELAAARFRLYQAVTELVRHAAAARPLLVVVDDLHWADTGSLGLLAFLAAELEGRSPGGAGHLPRRGRWQPASRWPRRSARWPASRWWSASARGPRRGRGRPPRHHHHRQPAGERLVRAVHDRTEGNPFFVTELLRLLQSEGDLHAHDALATARRQIPVGVRDVLRRRLARLPEQTNAVLLVAATAGREFDLDLVEAVTRLDEERALEAIEAAVVAGLLVEDDETVGRYRFAHGLVQETLYEQVSRARRVRLHARVAETLLGLHGPEDPEHAELARHAWAAVPVTGAEAALPYVLAAADHAMARLAYEQAEQQLRRALQLLESMPPSAERTRRELGVQVRLGHLLGELSSPGSPEAAAAFARAAELAAEVADDPAALPALAGVHEGYIIRAEFDRARALAERVLDGAQRSRRPAGAAGRTLPARPHPVRPGRAGGRPRTPPGGAAPDRGHARAGTAARHPPGPEGSRHPRDRAAAAEASTTRPTRSPRPPARTSSAPPPLPEGCGHGPGGYAAVHRRDPQLLRARAAAATALCERWGFQMLAASATAPLGWAQAIEGDPAGGASLLRQALAHWDGDGVAGVNAAAAGAAGRGRAAGGPARRGAAPAGRRAGPGRPER